MASIRQIPEDPRPFYCHQCSHQWMKAQNSLFECPRCRDGFIEEVSDDFNPNIPLIPPAASPFNYFLYEAFSDNLNNDDQISRSARTRNRGGGNNHRASRSRSPHVPNIVISSNDNRNQAHQDLQILLQRRNSSASRILSVAIDDIMSMIFTSERQRAMTQEQLNAIPVATITSEQCEAQLQCAICFEDFVLNENEVRKLLCNHFFHEKCIFPWLRNNASCPVCRTSLVPNQSDSDEETSSFIQIVANSQRARMRAANSNNEPGPSTSSGNSGSARMSTRIPQPTTSSGIRTRSAHATRRHRECPVHRVLPEASTTRSRGRFSAPIDTSDSTRQQQHPSSSSSVLRDLSSPISSRLRSRSSQRENDGNIGRRRLHAQAMRGRPGYSSQTNGISSHPPSRVRFEMVQRHMAISPRNSRIANPSTSRLRRRRNAIYLSPSQLNSETTSPSPTSRVFDNLTERLMGYIRNNRDSDLDTSSSSQSLVEEHGESFLLSSEEEN